MTLDDNCMLVSYIYCYVGLYKQQMHITVYLFMQVTIPEALRIRKEKTAPQHVVDRAKLILEKVNSESQ